MDAAFSGFVSDELLQVAQHCLTLADPQQKVDATFAAAARMRAGQLRLPDANTVPPAPISSPGRPDQPRLVAPRDVPQRKLSTPLGRVGLIHAVAHIEFNAINLAWDAVYRFRGMPAAYYADWVSVADDEARHFTLLQARLAELGHRYGDFEAHDGLWQAAVVTADSCLKRMALVPRVLEARGLDVTPGMIERLRSVGDRATVAILDVILREEIAHVAAGTRWFEFCCGAAGLDPPSTFLDLLATHGGGAVRGPFNHPARLLAGFTASELAGLERRASRT
jgi:uncharacterized ferritin-like protein (DUF455 family)